ncbi:MAG: leucine-rich repeat domain-containing protein [Aureispira sp.]|nr:leucine-rich repeat domain-containing protein [Aureispira sp.]
MEEEKQSIIRLIASGDDTNIELALQLMKIDEALYSFFEARYTPIIRHFNKSSLRSLKFVYNEIHSMFYVGYTNVEDCHDLIPIEFLARRDNLKLHRIPTDSPLFQQLDQHANLKSLDLSFNKLKTFPLNICNCLFLKYLTLSDNRFQQLPTEIGQLQKLKTLRLNKNELIKLPDSIGELSSLRILTLSENLLENIPDTIQNLTNLRQLFLENNELPLKEKYRIKKLLPKCQIFF